MRSAPVLVGLCGRSGSGKGYVSSLFLTHGIPAIDTDFVYRTLTSPAETLSPCMKELIGRFGESIRNSDNSLNRDEMRRRVFGGDTQVLNDLNRITHHHILLECERIVAELYENGYRVILIDAPLLYESGFDRKCERVIVVTAPESVILKRIMERDGIGEKAAHGRLATQKSADALKKRADYVIINDGQNTNLTADVRAIAEELKALAES